MNASRTKPTCALFAIPFSVIAACASDPPPKPAEPAAPPLEVPPLPPQKEAPARPMTRDAPPPAPPSEGADQGSDPAEPSPLALPCRTDAECMTHRCNLKFGKCAFPCKTDRDCVTGATCFTQGGATAVCVPKQP